MQHLDMFEDHFCLWRDYIFKLGKKEFTVVEAHDLIINSEHWIEESLLDVDHIKFDLWILSNVECSKIIDTCENLI